MDHNQRLAVYNLEGEKIDLLEEKNKDDLGVIRVNEINERIKAIDQELLEIAKVKVQSEESKTLEKDIEKQRQTQEQKGKIVLDFETTEEAVAAAKENGLIPEDYTVLQTEKGDRVVAVINVATKGPNKGKVVVIYDKEYSLIRSKNVVDHEGDHFMVQELEEEYGPEVTFALANEIVEAFENGSLDANEEYVKIINKYKESGFKDKRLG